MQSVFRLFLLTLLLQRRPREVAEGMNPAHSFSFLPLVKGFGFFGLVS